MQTCMLSGAPPRGCHFFSRRADNRAFGRATQRACFFHRVYSHADVISGAPPRGLHLASAAEVTSIQTRMCSGALPAEVTGMQTCARLGAPLGGCHYAFVT